MASTSYRYGETLFVRCLRILLLAAVLGLAGCNLFDDNDNNEPPLQTGLQTISSGGAEREYYLQLPSDSDDGNSIQASALGDDTRKPLLFAYHLYTGSYQVWVGENRRSDLVDVVSDEAIFIAPNGLEDAVGKRTWGGQADLDFFLDGLKRVNAISFLTKISDIERIVGRIVSGSVAPRELIALGSSGRASSARRGADA